MQQSDECEIQTLMWRSDCNMPLYTLSMSFFFKLKKDDSKNCYPHMKQILSLKKKGKTFTGQYILHKGNNYTCLKLKLKLKLQHILKSPSCTFH